MGDDNVEARFNRAFIESDFHKEDSGLPGKPNVTQIKGKFIDFAQIANEFNQVRSFSEIDSYEIWANKLVEFKYYEQLDKVSSHAVKRIKRVAHRLFEFLRYLQKEELESEFVERFLGSSSEAVPNAETNIKVLSTIVADEPNARKQICQVVKVCRDICEDNVSGHTSAAQEIQRFIGDLDRFKSKIKQSEANEVIILGPTGVGKSFLLNMLLYLTEVPAPKYGVNWTDNDGYGTEDDDGHATEDDDEDAPGNIQVSLDELPRWLTQRSYVACSLTVVPPQASNGELAADEAKEVIALDALQSFCKESQRIEHILREHPNTKREDALRGSAHDKFKTRLRPYVLTTAPPRHNMPTTAHILEMCFASAWALDVEYMSVGELKEQLGGFVPSESSEDGKNQKELMLSLLNAVIDPSVAQASKRVKVEEGEEEEDTNNRLFREYPEDFSGPEDSRLKFKNEVRKVAGLKLYFKSSGVDSMKDRIYIRRVLNGCPNWPDLTHKPKQGADTKIIKRIVLYAPSLLLQQNIILKDIPESGDADPMRLDALEQSLLKCDAMLIMIPKTGVVGQADVYELLKRKIAPRFHVQNDGVPPKIGFFMLNEKTNLRDMNELCEEDMVDEEDFRQGENSLIELLINNPGNSVGNTPERKKEIKKMIEKMITKKSKEIRPLLYASILRNHTARLADPETAVSVIDRTGGNDVLKFILDVSKGDMVVETKEMLNKINAFDVPTASSRTFPRDLKEAETHLVTWWEMEFVRSGRLHNLRVALSEEESSKVLGSFEESMKRYWDEVKIAIKPKLENPRRKASVRQNAFAERPGAQHSRRVIPALSKYCKDLALMPLSLVQVQKECRLILLARMKLLVRTVNVGTLSNNAEVRGMFAAFLRGEGPEGGLLWDTIDQHMESLFSAKDKTMSALNTAVMNVLSAQFWKTFSPLTSISNENAFVVEYGKLHERFKDAASKALANDVFNFIADRCAWVFPDRVTGRSKVVPIIKYFFKPEGRMREKNFREIKAAVTNLRKDIQQILASQTAEDAEAKNLLEKRIMCGFVPLKAWRKNPRVLIFKNMKKSKLIDAPIGDQNQTFLLQDVIEKSNSATGIDEVVREALGAALEDKGTQFKFIDVITSWLPYLECVYMRHPKVRQKLQEMRKIVNEAKPDDVVVKYKELMKNPKYQALLLHGACEALDVVFRVHVADQEYLVTYDLPRCGQVHQFDLKFDQTTGQWSVWKDK